MESDDATVQTTVNAKKLLDILKALPDGKDVSLKLNDSKIAIASGKSKFNLQTLPANDFPEMTLSGSFGQKSASRKTFQRSVEQNQLCHGGTRHSLLSERYVDDF